MENQTKNTSSDTSSVQISKTDVKEKLSFEKSFRMGIFIGLGIAIVVGILTFSFQQSRINKVTKELESQINQDLRAPDGAYERNLKLMEEIRKAREAGQAGFTIADARDKLMSTSGWNEKKVVNTKQYAEGESQDYSFMFKYPSDWNLSENVDEKGCGEYKVSKQQIGQLNINVECGSWAATYYPIPGDSVIVGKVTGTTNDGSAVYLIRFLADSNVTYRYVEVLVYPPDREISTKEDRMEDKIFLTAPILLNVELRPNGYGSDMETALLVADTIVNSISK